MGDKRIHSGVGISRYFIIQLARQTEKIARILDPDWLNDSMDPAREQQMWEEGAVVAGARKIADYWASRTVTGLLLMPASRNIIIHPNQARQLRHDETRAGK